jgi:cytochrome oxidase Cu insertion factor (SCO1/SenC/PrrC family)
LNEIKKMPQPVEGDDISNRIVRITSNPVRDTAPSRSMASVGGMFNFNKHVSTSSKNVQKKE